MTASALREMFGLKRGDVTKIYSRLLHINFINFTNFCYDRHQGWEYSSPDRRDKYIKYFNLQTQRKLPLSVVNADRKLILKENIIVHGAKTYK
jgi:hypothetical protein